MHRQLELSDGLEPQHKRLGYKRALAKAYLTSGQPQEAILHLQELLKDDSISPTDRLDLLCKLADGQVTSTWLPLKTFPSSREERVDLEHASSLVQAIGDVCKFESACGAGSASWVSAWVCPLGAALRSGTYKNLSTVCLVQLALLSESGAGESGGIDAVAEVVEQTVPCPRFAAYHEAYAQRLLSQCRSSGCLKPAPALSKYGVSRQSGVSCGHITDMPQRFLVVDMICYAYELGVHSGSSMIKKKELLGESSFCEHHSGL